MLDCGDAQLHRGLRGRRLRAARPNGAILHFALAHHELDEVAARVRAFGAKITDGAEGRDDREHRHRPRTVARPGADPDFLLRRPSGEVIEFFQNTVTLSLV